MKKSIAISFGLMLFLTGCPDPNKKTDDKNENPPPIVSNIKKTNKVELGPIKGANVAISTLDGQQFLYSTVTDDYGKYTIDINQFKENLNYLSTYPDYVLVSSTNGLDIDPEDDGDFANSEPIPVNGTVKGIFKVSTLLNNNDLSINLISTAITNILKDKKNIDSEQIAYTARELGVEDINDDGKIDNKDVYLYNMSQDSSKIEDDLRKKYLGAIHKGDLQTIEEVTNKLKEQYNLMFIKFSINNAIANLTIEPTKENSQILYKINAKKGDLFTDIYSSPITLNINDYVVYKECKDNSCSKMQIASFDGKKVHQYFLRKSDFGIYENVEYMNNLRQKIIDNSKQIDTIENDISNLNKNIKEKDNSISEINKEINNIQNSDIDYEF